MSSLVNTVDPDYRYRWAIRSNGDIARTDLGAYGDSPQVTTLVELEPGTTYELYHACTYGAFRDYMNLNVYDVDQNRTRTMNFYDSTGNVPTIIALASNEKYIRLTYEHCDWYPNTLIRVKAVETPITLPQIPLFPNSINTINVTNTIKPAEIYVEVAEPSEDDPEDPMSEYTGIIYNDGILDVTQDDPDNLNIITFHYRDNVTKDITIDAGVKQCVVNITQEDPDNLNELTISYADGTSTVINIPGGSGGVTYEAGVGIDIQQGKYETYRVVEYFQSDGSQTVDTGYCKTVTDGSMNFEIKWRLISTPTTAVHVLSTHDVGASEDIGSVYIGVSKGSSMSEYKPAGGIITSSDGASFFQYDSGTATSTRSDIAGFDNDGDISFNIGGLYSIDTGATWRNVFLYDSTPAVIYFCRIFDDDVLVCDLVPCIRDKDNAQGFYDRVREIFIENTGTPFTMGQKTGEVISRFVHESESDPYEISNTGIIEASYSKQHLELTLRNRNETIVVPVSDTQYTAGDNIVVTGQQESFTLLQYIQGKSKKEVSNGSYKNKNN